MKCLISLGLTAIVAAPCISAPVSVASGDWSNIPLARSAGLHRISTDVIERIEAAAIDECRLPGQSKRHLQLTIPFIIQFSPTGSVERLVVQRLNCPAIEMEAGGAILTMAQKGEFQPTGENTERWYRGQISIDSR